MNKQEAKSPTLDSIVAPPYEPTVKDIVRDAKGRLTKGNSGNLKGMPIGTISLVRLLKRRLKNHPDDADKIIDALVKMGKTGDMRAIEHLFDRIDGKVAETHKITGELPVKLLFVPAVELLGQQKQLEEGDKV